MDNFRINIVSEGDEALRKAMELAFRHYKAEGFLVDRDSLIFLWSMNEGHIGSVRLPFKMDSLGATNFALQWLAEVEYGSEPDHDGDNGRGWRVYNEEWGNVSGLWSAIVGVQPVWAMYGK